MDETFTGFTAKIDAGAKSIALSRGNLGARALSYQQSDDKSLIIDGALDGKRLHLQLSSIHLESFVLSGPRFHWIQEFPVNR